MDKEQEDFPELYDMFGERICRGNVIFYAATGIMKSGIIFDIKTSMHRHRLVPEVYSFLMKTIYRGTVPRLHSYQIKVHKDELEDRIMILKNPLFYVHSKKIAHLLEIADLAKDAGMLPDDYELGTSVEYNY